MASDLDHSVSAQIWLAGSLAAHSWSHAAPAVLNLLLIVPAALWHARQLALLEMGDDAASQLGVSVERTRLVMVMTAVSLTALATAPAVPTAFIVLAAPQLVRDVAARRACHWYPVLRWAQSCCWRPISSASAFRPASTCRLG